MGINRIDAWNKVVEEIDARTLEDADGLSVNELLELIRKNYPGQFTQFVGDHKDDFIYKDTFEEIQTVEEILGEVYDEDRKNLLSNDKEACRAVINESVVALLKVNQHNDISKAYMLLSLIDNVRLSEEGNIVFTVAGKKYRLYLYHDN